MVKTVSVVCSAAYLKGKKFGVDIDKADIVVRVNSNSLIIEEHKEDIGERTDIIYLCNRLYKKRNTLSFPEGVTILKSKVGVIPHTKDRLRRYEANTGVLCTLDYAMQGYKVNVYGMDFYSGTNNGIIPNSRLSLDKPYVTKVAETFLKGYRGKNEKETTKLIHVGGKRDLDVFLFYQEQYDINFDYHTKEVIKNNL